MSADGIYQFDRDDEDDELGDVQDDCEDSFDCDEPEYCFTCNNLGTVPCECGGDICVCLNNGEMPCPDCDR